MSIEHPTWRDGSAGSDDAKPYPALCRNCKHSRPEANSSWNLKCQHPRVNAADPWALSRADEGAAGTDCRGERERRWFAPCGMSGKLYEGRT